VIEIGEERYELGGGDSLLVPRKVAHAWAHVREGTGRLIAALQPARDRVVLRRSCEVGKHSGARGAKQSGRFAGTGASRAALVDRITDLPRVSENSVKRKFARTVFHTSTERIRRFSTP
jgi:hypothetical protein